MTAASALLFALVWMQSPAPPQPDITLSLACGGQPSEIVLTIRNSGQADTAVLLGISMANGQWYLPRELVVELKRTGNPDIEQLLYQAPTNIAGRMDHWIVALPVAASFILPISSTDFLSTSRAPATSPPEELRVRLTARPIASDLNVDMTGMKAWRVWTGTTVSNAVRLANCR